MKNSFYGVLKAKKGGLKMVEKKNIKQSHSRMFLSGILDACRCKIKGKIPELARVRLALSGSSTHAVVVVKQGNPLLNKRQTASVEDPETSSGITLFDERQMARGFTLIELLVVVLIIGILAAVALPQYQFAVTKTRIKTYLPVLADMTAANELYYLANGVYAVGNQVEDLDITMPPSCTHFNWKNVWKCDTDFMIDSSDQNGFILHYCPKYNSSFDTCKSNRIVAIIKYYNNYSNSAMAGKWLCAPHSDLGTKLCASLLD